MLLIFTANIGCSVKVQKSITISDASQKIWSGLKLNKTRVDQDSEFYNRSSKSWLLDYDIKTYSTHYEEKSVVAERFISTKERVRSTNLSLWYQKGHTFKGYMK